MSDSSGSWASDSSSERSYASETYDPVCAFRTPRFHHHECSRYFDCPTHTIERSESEAENSADEDQEQEQAEQEQDDDIASDDANEDEPVPGDEARPLELDDSPPSEDQVMSSRQRGKAPELAGAGREIVDLTGSSPEPTRQPSPDAGPSNAAETSTLHARPASQHDTEVIDLTENTPPSGLAPEAEGAASTGERALPTIPTVGSSSSISSRRAAGAESPSGHRRPATPPSPPPPTRRRTSNNNFGSASRGTLAQPQRPLEGRRPSDIILPRWQPDAEVTFCPICHTQFSIFVRKHHCR